MRGLAGTSSRSCRPEREIARASRCWPSASWTCLAAPYAIDGTPAVIGASIGIARSHDCPDLQQLFHNADLALYRVKAEGRNGFRLFEAEMDAAEQARRRLEAELRKARDRGEFEIHYQPIVGMASGSIVSVEALLRWNHPARGRLSPAEFMPVAEEIGLMATIDAWVLETACAEAMRWPGAPRIAINLSPAKFKRRNLVDVVRRALSEARLPPQRLELEISERILLRGDDGNVAALQALRDLGVARRARRLRHRLSRRSATCARSASTRSRSTSSFVAEMESRADCTAIVAAIAGLGRSIGADTTAEGIETQAQADLARAAGCTEAQGYLFSRPVSAGAIAALLRDAEGGALKVA